MHRLFRAASVAILSLACGRATPHVSLCDLVRDPAKYNHQEIQLSGFVSHGFEDFILFDPTCPSNELTVWLEYGGTYGSGTVYCCNDPAQARPQQLTVEGIPTTLTRDEAFRRFDQLIQKERDTVIYATLRGRYFSGEKQKLPGGTVWAGYGHFGLSSLFVIEQVTKVTPHELADVDYRASYDRPALDGVGCFSSHYRVPSYLEIIAQQHDAEAGASWRFDAPAEVARRQLQSQLKGARLALKQTKRAPGRIVFEGTASGRPYTYMVVVSRPYWLTRYAAHPQRVIWVVAAAYESGCPPAKPPWPSGA
jgi:hypothetical protein